MGDIKINVSGGNAQLGNVSQGDNNTLTASWQSWSSQQNIDEFVSAITQLEERQEATSAQVTALKAEVAALTEIENKPDLADRVRQLYEKYSWAAGPLKRLFTLVL